MFVRDGQWKWIAVLVQKFVVINRTRPLIMLQTRRLSPTSISAISPLWILHSNYIHVISPLFSHKAFSSSQANTKNTKIDERLIHSLFYPSSGDPLFRSLGDSTPQPRLEVEGAYHSISSRLIHSCLSKYRNIGNKNESFLHTLRLIFSLEN